MGDSSHEKLFTYTFYQFDFSVAKFLHKASRTNSGIRKSKAGDAEIS
jgi:hypothetical protein